jgi:hypothetical protein
VLLDPETSAVRRIISLQYNPDSVSRTLQVQGTSEGGGDRSEPLRITAPPTESIKVDAEIDLTDQLEFPDQNRTAVEQGLYPYLATLETIIYPTSGQLQTNQSLSMAGMLEIIPMQASLAVFVWSKNRVVPVRITEFSVTEEAFDPMLNPIRAKVSLGMRVLTVYDLGFSHKGGNVFMAYLQQKERLATMSQAGSFGALGITGIP